MAQTPINIGTTADDGTGDDLRTAFDKANNNFSDLVTQISAIPAGPVGATGPQGPTGATGATGPTGAAGPAPTQQQIIDAFNALGLVPFQFGIESVGGVAELTVDNVGDLTLTITGGVHDGVYAVDSSATTLTAATIITTTAIIVDPVVSGTAGTGEVLTAQPSLFLWLVDEPAAPTYKWQRDGVDIAGATALTYTQVVADEGTDVTFLETYDGVTATSNAISVPAAPASFTLVDELDASAPATITDSGGEVSAWGDVATNEHNWAQSTVGEQPTTGLVAQNQNGLNTLAFDNSDYLIAGTPRTFSPSGAMFMAFRVNTVASSFNAIWSIDFGASTAINLRAGNSTWFGEIDSTRHGLLTRGTAAHGVWVVQAYAWDIANTKASLWTNGVKDAEVFDYTVAYGASPVRMHINANSTTFGRPDSNIAYFKTYSDPMTDSQIQAEMAAIQSTWGIA